METTRRITALFGALALSVSLATEAIAEKQDAEVSALLQQSREALGQSPDRIPVQLSGKTTRHGLPAKFRWTFGMSGAFLLETEGPFPETTGCDGRDAWKVEALSPPYPLVFLGRERSVTAAGILSGEWCANNSPFDMDIESSDEVSVRLRMKLVDGLLTGHLTLSANSHLPRRFEFDEAFGGGSLLLEDWQVEEGRATPARITITPGQGVAEVFEVQDAGPLKGAPSRYGPPQSSTTDARFDSGVASELEVRRVESGHLFVRPLVDGKDLGWFLFDSGLGGLILKGESADALGLKSFGETFVGGFGGPPKRAVFRQGKQIQLGPLLIDNPVFIEQESMGMADRMLGGEPCAGALGWDVFLRSVVEVDPGEGTVRLFDPRSFEAPDAHWEPLALHWQVPYVHARFAGNREGWFCIDTGAGKLTALFHFSAATRLGLLGGIETGATAGQGARGGFVEQQKELEWFEIAGHRHSPAQVQLSVAEDGESDPYALGFVGAGFLEGDRLLFDYSSSRLGFLHAE